MVFSASLTKNLSKKFNFYKNLFRDPFWRIEKMELKGDNIRECINVYRIGKSSQVRKISIIFKEKIDNYFHIKIKNLVHQWTSEIKWK